MHRAARLSLFFLFLFFLAAVALWGQNAGGVAVRMYVKPEATAEGARLHVLVRVPLNALTGVALPYRAANGELDLSRLDAMLPGLARWSIADRLDVYEGDTLLSKPEILAARVSLPADNAFASYDEAWRHIFGPKLTDRNTQVFREQAMVDVALDYAIGSITSPFSIRPALGQLGSSVTTALEFLPPDSSHGAALRKFEYTGDPGLFFLDPTVGQVFRRFTRTGMLQVLSGTDDLLFLFCVALGMSRMRELFSLAAIFTAVQSLTLAVAADGFTVDALWFPLFIDALIALTILFLAFEIMANKALLPRRWILAVCGAIFGYGFSFGLNPARQFAGPHALASVLSYDLGLQLGIFPALAVFAAALLVFSRFTRGRVSGRTETIVLSVLLADLAWHRLTDRVDHLRQFHFVWPRIAAPDTLGWTAILLVAAGAILVALALLEQRKARIGPTRPSSPATPDPDLSS